MNLALHGFLLQVILSILDFKYGLCSAGEPGYLDFDNLPETNFSCQGKVIGGYYADVEAGCQMFHVCTIGQKDEIMDIKFLCLNGTVFDQETRVCERVDEVDCSKSERFYNLNLELYGNNAVTLSLHEESLNDDEPPILIDDHHQTTSVRPSTTTSTTTTPRPVISLTTSSSGSYQHPNAYPQPFQHHPPFPSVQTSQSKSHYDDKNGGYHRQYIYHNGDHNEQNDEANNDNQATSYQLFSNRGASSTTRPPQIHQISTVAPLYHATSSTLETLLTGNANNPPLINPIFHNHGIISTTEQYTLHNNNPRETPDYQRNRANGGMHLKSNEERILLEPIQSTSQGKVSKLTISPVPQDSDKINHKIKTESAQQHQLAGGFLSIPPSDTGPPTVRSFYPTPKTLNSETSTTRVTQHIHLPPPPPIPQLKPHQVTIHLSPPEIQRLVQNPSPLLPSQSRVIVTAKASVSDESGRPLNTTQLVTLPQPTVPASYDDYKEGDESFDPFYRDVPKIRNSRKSGGRFAILLGQPRKKRMVRSKRQADTDKREINIDESSIDIDQFYDQEIEDTTVVSTDFPDHSDVTSGGDTVLQQTDNYKTEEEYDDEYYNDTQGPTELDSLEKINSTVDESKKSSDEIHYNSEEYSLLDEIDDDKNLTSAEYFDELEYSSITEEPETDVTETPVTTEQTEITTTVESNKLDQDMVLKFTEEIPQTEQREIQEDRKVVFVDIPDVSQDYVDDNYEPESYKGTDKSEMITTTDKEYVTESSINESLIDKVVENVTSREIPTLSETIATTSSTTPSTPIESSTMNIITTTSSTTPSTTTTILTTASPIISTSSSSLSSTTPSTTTTVLTTASPLTSTSSSSSSSSTTSTTRTTTTPSTPVTHRRYTTSSTTVYRPTAPKIKIFSTRKTYIYSPPSTTPVPVIIKTRLSLLNPYPAKPPKSYNELAPKPIIRKRPLLARRVTSTVTAEEKESENITTTTEFITSTNKITSSILPESSSRATFETTTGKKSEGLSEKLLERISDAVGQKIIEQINDLTTTTSNSIDFIEMVTTSVTHSTPLSTSDDEATKQATQMTTDSTTSKDVSNTTPIIDLTTSLRDLAIVTTSQLASVLSVNQKPMVTYKRVNGFNCLEKEMYRFYADKRDCRLFHYCSPGFTARQVLDFRFVCEEGTIFDEETQSCLHEVKNVKCREKTW